MPYSWLIENLDSIYLNIFIYKIANCAESASVTILPARLSIIFLFVGSIVAKFPLRAKISIFKINITTMTFYNSSPKIINISKIVSQHIKNCNIRLWSNPFSNAYNLARNSHSVQCYLDVVYMPPPMGSNNLNQDVVSRLFHQAKHK